MIRNFIYFWVTLLIFWSCGTKPEKKTGETKKPESKQENKESKNNRNFTVAFYNVENLFDTEDDPKKRDEDFLPSSKKKWTIDRYQKKLKDLSKVLSAIDKNDLPEIIGLAEVENKKVVEDLAKEKSLSGGNYKVVHEESPDKRGIDVALMYKDDSFKYLFHKAIPIKFSFDKRTTTRDILYVKGVATSTNETMHIFVNHWSSRRGGQEKSEPKRVQAAKVLRAEVEKIQTKNPNAKIIIVGDMNDEPNNKSIHETLKATGNKSATSGELFNLMYEKDKQKLGTHSYKGKWGMLDNIIISRSLLKSENGYHTTFDGGKIFKEDWILYNNTKAGHKTPSRTYGGRNYFGGYSDHLPVYVTLSK